MKIVDLSTLCYRNTQIILCSFLFHYTILSCVALCCCILMYVVLRHYMLHYMLSCCSMLCCRKRTYNKRSRMYGCVCVYVCIIYIYIYMVVDLKPFVACLV